MEGERNLPRWLLRGAVALLVLPLLYAVSFGPALLAWNRGWLGARTVWGAYLPLTGGWDPAPWQDNLVWGYARLCVSEEGVHTLAGEVFFGF